MGFRIFGHNGLLSRGTRLTAGIIDGLAGSNIVGDYDAANNFDLAQAQLQYQKDLQQQIFAREDNAVQRRAKDLEAAGFNRLLAAGGSGAGTGSVVSTVIPQRATAKYNVMENLATRLSMEQGRANIAKTVAETAVAGATEKNLLEQNKNLQRQNELLQAQTIKTIADATGWSETEVAMKLFGFGFSYKGKSPNKDYGPENNKFINDKQREFQERVKQFRI